MGAVGHHLDIVDTHGGVSIVFRADRADRTDRLMESRLLEFRHNGELVLGEIVRIELVVRMEGDKALQIVGSGEFSQQFVELFFRIGEILG